MPSWGIQLIKESLCKGEGWSYRAELDDEVHSKYKGNENIHIRIKGKKAKFGGKKYHCLQIPRIGVFIIALL